MAANLTHNAIERIMSGEQLDNPVLQVLGTKKMSTSGGNGVDRYRMLMSDGNHSYSSAMLATQLNGMVENNDIAKFCIVQLDKFMCNTIQGDRRVMIILEVTVLQPAGAIGNKIGNPEPYSKPSGGNPEPYSKPSGGTVVTTAGDGGAHGPVSNTMDTEVSGGTSGGKNFYNQASNRQPPVNRQPLPNRPPPPAAKRPPLTAPGTPTTPGGTPARVHPINSLTPYQNRWTIRARVTQKQPIKHYSNPRGSGKLFNMTLMDESGDIRATGFNDVVDKFYEMIEVDKVYYLSKGSLKAANKQYNATNNDYELTLNNETTIVLCEEDVDLPAVKYNFVPINQLDQHQPNTTIDIIGVVMDVDELKTIIGKTSQREMKKRDVHLGDDSKVKVRLTIWGQEAENFKVEGNPVMVIKGAKLSDFGGRTLSALSSSQVLMNPSIPESHQLRGWYDSVGHSESYEEFRNEGGASSGGGGGGANWKSIAQVKNDSLGSTPDSKAEYFTYKATILYMKKENCMYMACASDNCNKKVVDQSNNTYRCEKCNKEQTNFKWRMILQLNVADHTDNQWVTCFQDTAEAILGKPAAEIGAMREQDETGFEQLFQEATFKSFVFKMRAKIETYNDEARLKTVCVQANATNWPEYSNHLIQDIDRMLIE